MNEKEKQSVEKAAVQKPETSPELPSKNMEDAKQDALVNTISEDEIDNKIAEETGKDQPLPEDVEEANHLKDSEVEQIADEAAAAVAAEPDPPVTAAPLTQKTGKFGRLKHWCGRHKVWAVIIALILVLGVLAAVPFTRFAVAGTFLKQDFRVHVVDTETKKPVASARVSIDGLTGTTNGEGYVTISQKVGPAHIEVSKAQYAAAHTTTTVPIFDQKKPLEVSLKATGRQTSLTVIDKISGKPIENVSVNAGNGIESMTDSKGVAQLVVPADQKTIKVTLMVAGYNTATTTLTIGEALKANEYSMTPSGKLYFLSNKSGKIDVVKTDLDGTNRQTVVAGTGKEDANGTALLASRDWKYLVLYSKRDDGKTEKIYLIDTSSDKMTVMDEGNATFQLVGWSGHTFNYIVHRTNVKNWEPKQTAIKSFNAENRKLTTLDQTDAEGDETYYKQQYFSNFYIVDDKIVYSTYWSQIHKWYTPPANGLDGKVASIRSITINGQNKKDYKTFEAIKYAGIYARAYEPQTVYFQVYNTVENNKPAYFEFEDNALKDVALSEAAFAKDYPTFLLSPSSKATLWSEGRDGKLALFTGNADGSGEKQLPGVSEYSAYGWYSDKYVLATQKGSELFIIPVEGGKPLKVADYYKPVLDFRGYGSGYGGL
jgi:hypothetical protein